MNSVKRMARFAGLLYLVIFIVYPMATAVGRAGIQLPGEAGTTVENLIASETLFRIGVAGEAVFFLVEVVLAGVLYALLRPVSRALSLAAAMGRLAEAVVQAVNLLTSSLVLLLVGGAGYLTAFEPDQLNALALLFLDAKEYVILVWGFFFGLHLLLLGYLVYKSGYFPQILGILLMLASFGYLLESYGRFLLPQHSELFATIVLVLAIPGELVFTVWLLWKGIDVEQYEKRALASA